MNSYLKDDHNQETRMFQVLTTTNLKNRLLNKYKKLLIITVLSTNTYNYIYIVKSQY